MDADATAAMLRRSIANSDDPKTAHAVREFDSYFLAQILKSAKGSSEEHMLDGGSAGRMYRDQFFDEMARYIAKQGGFGMTEQVQHTMKQAAEERPTEGTEAQS